MRVRTLLGCGLWLGLSLPGCGEEAVLPSGAQLTPARDAGFVGSHRDDVVIDAQAPTPDAAAPGISYVRDVRPILSRTCVPCHSEGQIAPLSLDTYERARPFAELIAKVTRARTMPPSVIDNTGECNTFSALPWLKDNEIDTLERWADAGAPEGDPSVPPPAPFALPKLTGDVRSLTTPPYRPSTAKRDDYRCFVVDSPIDVKTFITGFDTRPGDKKIAHHMVVFYPMDDTSALLGRLLDDLEEGPGYTCFGGPGTPATVIAAWAPGGGATLFPSKLGIAVEPRPLIVQMHYNTSGITNPGEDSTQIDLQLQNDGSVLPAALLPMLDLEMNLPAGQPEAQEVVSVKLGPKLNRTGPVEIHGLFPHMHELGKTQRISAARSDGSETCLLDVPRWDFHWQRLYFLDQPIIVDAEDEIKVDCHFDTTSRSEVTKWGEGTQDEMCVVGVFVKL